MSDEEKQRQAIIVENGLNSYEGLQNRQDFCIKFNILFGQNVWSIPNRQSFEMIEELKAIGLYDQFEIEHLEKIQDEDTRMKLNAILEKYKLQ